MRRRGRSAASLVRAVCALLSVRAASLTAQQPTERPAWCATQPRLAYATLPRVSVPSDWFEVYRVDPDVYAIYEPHQWQEVISYLIVGRERAWTALRRDKKVEGGRVRLVLLEAPGRPIVGAELPEAEVRSALDALIAG